MKRLIFFSLAVLLMTGCKQQDDESMFPDRPDVREYVVSTDEAENAAFYFLYMTDNQVQTRNAVRDVKDAPVIKKKFTIEGYNGKPAMHVINYEKGGFTVISGDKRIEPVIAYSDTGDWSDNPLDYPDGLRFWIKYVKDEIKAMDEQGIEPSDELRNLWETYVPSTTTRIIDPPSHPCEDPESYEITVGPLVQTSWEQRNGFNDLMPKIYCSGDSIHAFAGCVPIASAQLAKYFGYPTSYSWNSMPGLMASTATKNLIKDIHDYLSSINDITYDCDGTWVSAAGFQSIFTNLFGYSIAAISAYNTNNLRSHFLSTDQSLIHPVGMLGREIINGIDFGGHVWICDGYHEWIECFDNNGEWQWYPQYQFHMNWGYGNSFWGWYWAGTSYSINNHTYNSLYIMNVIP